MGDLISKQDAINALIEKGQSTKRYKLGDFWELNLSEIKEALDELPFVETGSDMISRKMAINALKRLEDLESNNFTDTDLVTMVTVAAIANCIEEIVGIPSAEPERTAKVIDKSVDRHSISDFDWTGKCEKCGNGIQFAYDFCPYCGSRLDWSDNK